MEPLADCLVVGGGPGGLTAAIYLARFHLRVQLFDAGASRASLIPCTHNHAGFPEGISGQALIDRMHRQALMAGAELHQGRVDQLTPDRGEFVAQIGARTVRAKTVLLATGVTNYPPQMPSDLHAAALLAGRLRYCPVCDGFEVTDQTVAVIGSGARGMKEALFLRSYTQHVTLVSDGRTHTLEAAERTELAAAGIDVLDGPAMDFRLEPDASAWPRWSGVAPSPQSTRPLGRWSIRTSPGRWAPTWRTRAVSRSTITSGPACRVYTPLAMW